MCEIKPNERLIMLGNETSATTWLFAVDEKTYKYLDGLDEKSLGTVLPPVSVSESSDYVAQAMHIIDAIKKELGDSAQCRLIDIECHWYNSGWQ